MEVSIKMTKRTRTILFLACFLLFALIAPSAVLYSQGYRIDLENRKFTQTGGLFIKVAPRQVDIYVDGKLEKKTDFFFGSVLVENLLPKKYNIEIKKEGYHSWEKALEIKERQVQEVKNVILFPQNVNFDVLSGQIERLWFSPDQRKIITQEEEKLGWALKLYDLDKNIKSRLMAEEDIFVEGSELVDLTFSQDSKKIDLEIAAKEKVRYFVLELDKATPVPTETTPPESIIENAVAYQQVNNDFYYLDGSGHLFKNGTELTSQPFPIKQETEYVLSIFQNHVFLQETDTLYKFNNDSKSFEFFFDRIKSLRVSPDNKKLAYFSEHEIWILFLDDKSDPPQKKSGEKTFLMRLSEEIIDVFWVNDNYLIFAAGEVIKISEIDDRDKLNVVDIFETKKLPENGSLMKVFWNQSDKKLYLLKEKSLYGSDVILP